MSKIKSKSDLFPGILIDKPKVATSILNAKGDYIFKCPYCGNCADAEHCDVIGAEPDCLFCNQCNREFHV